MNPDSKLEGAPIGLELAGALARVLMLWWDKQFLSLASANAIILYLYKRYVDDENMAVEPLPPGTRWTDGPWAGGLIDEDKQLQPDFCTMNHEGA